MAALMLDTRPSACLLDAAPQAMPDNLNLYQELIWQLERLPGGRAAAMTDFFAHLLVEMPQAEVWHFKHGGMLILHADGELRHDDHLIAPLPDELRAAASAAELSAILLALLAIATGDIEGDRRLKAALPQVDAAAKDLMLMTVCRLCG